MSTMDIKSKINMMEEVENKERKFGSTLNYYPAYIVMSDGEELPALFTSDQLKDAMERAAKNPEDLVDTETEYADYEGGTFWNWLVGG